MDVVELWPSIKLCFSFFVLYHFLPFHDRNLPRWCRNRVWHSCFLKNGRFKPKQQKCKILAKTQVRISKRTFFFLGGWTTGCGCSQPPCRRTGPRSGVATTVKGNGPLTLETGRSRSSPPSQQAPQPDKPTRAAPATPRQGPPVRRAARRFRQGGIGAGAPVSRRCKTAAKGTGAEVEEGHQRSLRMGLPVQGRTEVTPMVLQKSSSKVF